LFLKLGQRQFAPPVRAVIERVLIQYVGALAGAISAPAQAARFSADVARELGRLA
jgi:hypothetical protein